MGHHQMYLGINVSPWFALAGGRPSPPPPQPFWLVRANPILVRPLWPARHTGG